MMIPCTAREIAAAVGGRLLQDGGSITRVSTDSRDIRTGDLFVPLVGERFDGHAYLDMALSKGAAGCLCAAAPETLLPEKFYIAVEDTERALGDLAGWYRRKFAIPVVQVTGSAGKTTTKEMLAAVLGQHFNTLKTLANYNNFIGTPQTLFRLEQGHEAAVIETGMDHFGQIARMGEMVQPTVAVITNVGDAHIGNLDGTRQGVLRAKSEIFAHLAPDGLAVLNGDDPLLNTLALPFKTLRCGEGAGCNVRVTDVAERGIEGVSCTVTTEKGSYALSIPSPGRFMIYSASMGVAIGEQLGLSRQEIIDGVAAYTPTGSRMRLLPRPDNRLIIDDCYNANPQAMAAALRLLAGTDRPRRMAVLGDMGELGELSAEAHAGIGRLLNELKLDCVVAIGRWMAYLAQAAEGNVYHFDTAEQAYSTLRREFTSGTVALVKASHAMHFEKIVEELEKA